MKVVIAGGSGFIGRNLTTFLEAKGIETIALNRINFEENRLQERIEGCDVLVNLVGSSIAGLWTEKRKRAIYNSRIATTGALVKSVNNCVKPVKTFIHVSAVGLYNNEGIHDEHSERLADNFLRRVIVDWEKVLHELDGKHSRLIVLRLGAVLGSNGGILSKLKLLRYLGLGFGVRSEDGFAFIHIRDLLRIFDFLIDNNKMMGIFNGVAQEISTISNFYRQISRVYKHRFTLLVNARFVKFILGGSAVMVTKGQRVVPLRLKQEGFVFEFPDLQISLFNLLH